MTGSKQKKLLLIAAIISLSAAIFITGWLILLNRPAGNIESITVEIKPGMTAGEIAEMLFETGIIRSPVYFKLLAKLRGFSRRFKAGEHPLSGHMKTADIARLLTQNPPVPQDIRLTIIEGLTIHETASVIAARSGIDSAAFVTLATDKSIAEKLGVDNDTLEGYLYPDTYFVQPGTEPLKMITRMVNRFNKVFNDSLRQRASEIGMTISEAVTLASIIEAEVSVEGERPLVSSVFHRRLKRNRPLEANPTVQYALGSKRRILYEDLAVESPYNTYIHTGLPPGPIASPGKKSLVAALYPADTKYLYFVANGNGGHVFSRTITEHTRAVRKYRKVKKNSRVQ